MPGGGVVRTTAERRAIAWPAELPYALPAGRPTLADLVAEAEAAPGSAVMLSLASDPVLDGAGMAALVRLFGRCAVSTGRRLYLRHVSVEFRRELARVGLDGLIPIVE
jgi:anti-anti-sigma regulatory factor